MGNPNPLSIKWFLVSAISLFLMSLIRVEKLYVALFMLLVFSIFLVRLKSTCVLALPAGKVGIVICVWTVALISARLVNE